MMPMDYSNPWEEKLVTLEDEIENSRLGVKTGKTLKKGLLVLIGAVGGILLTVITQWILAKMNLSKSGTFLARS
jgi:pheromone shutdown protein TraB